ncbi:hypothetical protein [Modicisalibacter ilicicola]|uniref:hypothetical protein n=1 Tax=Modicisalibacter ilicicola TaxID=480814 RepID=UPI001114A59E|nr:hypothetical protein [Halomonas ilicicola]
MAFEKTPCRVFGSTCSVYRRMRQQHIRDAHLKSVYSPIQVNKQPFFLITTRWQKNFLFAMIWLEIIPTISCEVRAMACVKALYSLQRNCQ